MEKMYHPKTKEELKALCDDESIYLGDIDTSKITDMSGLFEDSERKDFSGIEKWDVSKVTDMYKMFAGAKAFNRQIRDWDVSNVVCMIDMFNGAESFNQPIDSWNVSNVNDMSGMFCAAKAFEQNLSKWKISSNIKLLNMFDKNFRGKMPKAPIVSVRR